MTKRKYKKALKKELHRRLEAALQDIEDGVPMLSFSTVEELIAYLDAPTQED